MGSSGQLPDALCRFLRPNAAPESVDDSFPDDCTLDNPLDYVGTQGPVLEGQLLNELDTLSEGTGDPGGIREKDVVRGVDQTVSRRPTLRPMLSAITGSIACAGASHTDLAAPNREFASARPVNHLTVSRSSCSNRCQKIGGLAETFWSRVYLVRTLNPSVRPPREPSCLDAYREGTGATRAQPACLEYEVNDHLSSGRSTSRDRGSA